MITDHDAGLTQAAINLTMDILYLVKRREQIQKELSVLNSRLRELEYG